MQCQSSEAIGRRTEPDKTQAMNANASQMSQIRKGESRMTEKVELVSGIKIDVAEFTPAKTVE